jgi:hypothetical protein
LCNECFLDEAKADGRFLNRFVDVVKASLLLGPARSRLADRRAVVVILIIVEREVRVFLEAKSDGRFGSQQVLMKKVRWQDGVEPRTNQ